MRMLAFAFALPLLFVVALVLTFGVVTSAEATLYPRLGGAAAYDDVLDITWTTNANISGPGTWADQVAWADSFSLGGVDDWRLASMSVAAGLPTGFEISVVDCAFITEAECRDNELGYMFYYNLGGSLGDDLTGNQTVGDVTFTNIQSIYWSGTEFVPGDAWKFGFVNGGQADLSTANVNPGWAVSDGDVFVSIPEPVAIDIKPGGGPNNINPGSGGFVQVAILTTDTLRAEDVDPLTVRYGPLGADIGGRLPRLKDVNHDGLIDLLFHFRTQETGIACDDTDALLTGTTLGGAAFEGLDSIKTVGCK